MSFFLRTIDPLKELRDLEKRFQSFYPEAMAKDSGTVEFSPSVNTREGEYAYHIEVDLPGVKKEDIKVEVNNGQLTISGERKTKMETKKDDYYRMESQYGKFIRTFNLSDQVDAENITANCEDGVLEVVLPKYEGDRGVQQVEVK
ncbi:Hsp20/alpha crystallin family protein [Hydrogenovibrio marinus]|uniref:Heat-shock protein Hsp20 n=1 Tax=Hydrogenovibrio marinus TaxID=28885 RepID=A0A067A157_HYDMR|nr:Hsp20/alpha crystallin family protein [Hydrogenovibrio marinus]KDN96090.1 heat-shock protein Hsp20 [Hydrogenovibrio marinus]BBN58412.1 heat-shock protein Hsp20 [Hydrogenovibrio marinus]